MQVIADLASDYTEYIQFLFGSECKSINNHLNLALQVIIFLLYLQFSWFLYSHQRMLLQQANEFIVFQKYILQKDTSLLFSRFLQQDWNVVFES